MNYKLCLFWITTFSSIQVLRASVDSCYYCSGTRECVDPMDYNEVSPRDCPFHNSYCIKYISTTMDRRGSIVGDQLTYRKCFSRETYLDENICDGVKKAEIVALEKFNYSLADFECYTCDETNCNSAYSNKWISLWWISLSLTIFQSIT